MRRTRGVASNTIGRWCSSQPAVSRISRCLLVSRTTLSLPKLVREGAQVALHLLAQPHSVIGSLFDFFQARRPGDVNRTGELPHTTEHCQRAGIVGKTHDGLLRGTGRTTFNTGD